jgi:hypothetical protein
MLGGCFSLENLKETSEAGTKIFFKNLEDQIARELHPLIQVSIAPLLEKCKTLGYDLQLTDSVSTEGVLSFTLLDRRKDGLRIGITVVITCGFVVRTP